MGRYIIITVKEMASKWIIHSVRGIIEIIQSVCHTPQEISDARRIRNQIMVNFELATQHGAEPEERRQLLHFVVVGGGPTGVEFSAEFYDFLNQVLFKYTVEPSLYN